MGWNEVYPQSATPLFDGIANGTDFYFVHSYHFIPDDSFCRSDDPILLRHRFSGCLGKGCCRAIPPREERSLRLSTPQEFSERVGGIALLKVRVIPTLLWKEVGLVKGVGFDSWRRVGTVLPAIKVYNTRQVDELIVVDISATIEGRTPDYDEIRSFSAECFVPLTVGGGVKALEDIKQLLRSGADKVCINSAAYDNPEIIREAANRFGSQCIVVSIDVRCRDDGHYECYRHSGTLPTGRDPVGWHGRWNGWEPESFWLRR